MSFDFKTKAPAKQGGGFSIGGGSETPNPLDSVEYTGDVEEDAGREFSALQKGFRERADRENKRRQRATDSEYWFAVCFESREEKEAFLKAARVSKKLMGDKYLDGRMLAKMLGIEM